MKRYIILFAVLAAMTGCGSDNEEPQPTVQTVEYTEATSETVSEEPIPDEVKPDISDVRVYCVKLDAARNEIISAYKDKIPEKLATTFYANSDALDEYMDKAAKDLSADESEKIFNSLKNLEIFFCDTMAKEIGAGDKIQKVAIAATKGADYYFEKASVDGPETTTTEGETEETTVKNSDKKEKADKKGDKSAEKITNDNTEKEK